MASVELNGEEQQIPAEEMTEQETAEIQPADVINHTEVEQPIEQTSEAASEETGDGEEVMDTTQPESETSGGGDSELPETYAGEEIPYDDCKIFVGGLSWDTDEDSLRKYFEEYGKVKDIRIKQDQDTKRSRGFGFVVFEDRDVVESILEKVQHTIDGKEVDVKKAIPHAIHQALKNRTKKIFVGGVPVDMPEEIIRGYFKQFGEIEEVALVTDKMTKKRRGFVFVTFIEEDSVDKCTEKTFHSIENTQVEVKRATPREQTAPRGGRGGGRGGRGGMRGAFGRGGYVPYGQYSGYGPGYAPYGGYGGYGGFPPQYGGGFQHYAGPGGYDGFYSESSGRGGYGSRYGPMKGGYNHGHGGGGPYHPYSR